MSKALNPDSTQLLTHPSHNTSVIPLHNKSISFAPYATQLSSHKKQPRICQVPGRAPPTFSPEIHELPYELYPKGWQKMQRSKAEQWEQLTTDNRQRDIERAQLKAKEQEKELYVCTFSPIAPKLSQREQPLTSGETVHSKLYEQADQRRLKIIERQKQRIEQEDRLMRPQKQSNNLKSVFLNSEKHDLDPLYKRVYKVIEEKRRNRQHLAQKQDQNYTFQPSINEKSEELCSKRPKMEGVVDRLIAEYKKKSTKLQQLKKKYEIELQRDLTFKPEISCVSASTDNTVRKSSRCEVQTPPSFKPQINPVSALITKERAVMTSEERLSQLYEQPVTQKAENLFCIAAEAYSQCRFNPEINPISKVMSSTTPKVHKCKKPQPQPTPTHQPRINAASRCMSAVKRSHSQELVRKKTVEKAESYRKEQEYEQVKECSFQPKTNRNKKERQIVKAKSMRSVAGVESYLQGCNRAQEKQRKKEAVERKLFKLEQRYDRRMQISRKAVSIPDSDR